jgi:hypothetical protein
MLLRNMVELEKLIEDRKREAQRKGLSSKIDAVVSVLGHKDGSPVDVQQYSPNRPITTVYVTDSLSIEKKEMYGRMADDCQPEWGVASLKVVVAKSVVFETEGGHTIVGYIPGAWEQVLEREYAVVQQKSVEKRTVEEVLKREERRRSDEVLRSRWGL